MAPVCDMCGILCGCVSIYRTGIVSYPMYDMCGILCGCVSIYRAGIVSYL